MSMSRDEAFRLGPAIAEQRIAFLDGLRGFAILSVILFHAYSRHSEIAPSGAAKFFLFEYGWAGVNLFFVISGYVILMTLRRSSGVTDFLINRWRRLFPAMLIVSLLVFFTADLFPERPAGSVHWTQLIPGLLFIHRGLIEAATGYLPGVLEGSYWSIYVEAHFYIVLGLLFFTLREKLSLIAFALIASMPILAGVLQQDKLLTLMRHVGLIHFPWFLLGAVLYRYADDRRRLAGAAAGALALIYLSSRYLNADGNQPGTLLLIGCACVLVFVSQRLQSVFTLGVFRVIGFASYPLYLVHENMMMAMIIKLGRMAPSAPSILLPVLPIAAVAVIGYLIARFVEPWLRARIDRLIAFRRAARVTLRERRL